VIVVSGDSVSGDSVIGVEGKVVVEKLERKIRRG
jgi:hypothetical protein